MQTVQKIIISATYIAEHVPVCPTVLRTLSP